VSGPRPAHPWGVPRLPVCRPSCLGRVLHAHMRVHQSLTPCSLSHRLYQSPPCASACIRGLHQFHSGPAYSLYARLKPSRPASLLLAASCPAWKRLGAAGRGRLSVTQPQAGPACQPSGGRQGTRPAARRALLLVCPRPHLGRAVQRRPLSHRRPRVLPVSVPIIPINTPEVEKSFGGVSWHVVPTYLFTGWVCAITTACGPHAWPATPAHHSGARPGGAPGRHVFLGRLIRRRVCYRQSGPRSATDSSMALY
jgi:hypothetical protein